LLIVKINISLFFICFELLKTFKRKKAATKPKPVAAQKEESYVSYCELAIYPSSIYAGTIRLSSLFPLPPKRKPLRTP